MTITNQISGNAAAAVSAPILILGGNGRTGKRIAERLTFHSIPFRLGSRSAAPAFDWTDRSTWPAAFEGMKAVYIAYLPDLSVPAAADDITALVALSKKTGIEKLVLLSGRGEPEAEACEQIVMQSGIDYTILRCSWFYQNFSESIFQEPLQAGLLALPVGEVKEPFIDADDIAEVAVAAFTQAKHANKLYELTGPQLLSFSDVTSAIAKATDRDIRYQQLTMDEYAQMLTEYGVPEEDMALFSYLFTEVLDGRNASLTDGVQQALGRKAKGIDQFIENNLGTGVWK